ncbi:metallophosphoesterase [Membranihabitans maritimus]|uniref:metallophosphoesterase n=1 Tax=Membranihabitans maritimus TaxID=2904244 RepID=UPI001F16D5A7|nr:metallophosphoesterase [Membranihabitans maritimus]
MHNYPRKVVKLDFYNKFVLLNAILFLVFQGAISQSLPDGKLDFVVKPYIQTMTDSSFTVMWETSVPVRSQLHFAETDRHILKPVLRPKVMEESEVTLHKLTIDGLEPDQLYFYQVVNPGPHGDTLKGAVTQMILPDYSQSGISFTVVGDNQGNIRPWERIIELMFKETPQFVVHVGDLVAYGHHKDDWTDEFFKQADTLIRHIPMYATIGNHEMNDEKFYQYFNLPYDDAFYTVKKGDLRIIFIDTNKDILPGSAQYKRLENTLAHTKEKWKIVVHHHPVFTSDIASYRSSLMATADQGDPNIFHLKTLYEGYEVDMVLSGHVHGYERTHPIYKNHINKENGVTYVITGGGGAGYNQESSYREWFSKKSNKCFHFLNVRIENNIMKVEAIDTSESIFDGWEFVKRNNSKELNSPLIQATPKYFIDSTIIAIENPNRSGAINYRINDENYLTSFDSLVFITQKHSATVSALISEPDNSSREVTKTAVKLPLMEKKEAFGKMVTADYFEGNFTVLSDFEQLNPDQTYEVRTLSLSEIQPRAKDHFAVRFKASILIPETAAYRFFLESFDGSSLLIDGREIIENDGVHYEIFKEGYAALEKGYHNIEVRYFDFERRETLNLTIGKQGGKMVDINEYINLEAETQEN